MAKVIATIGGIALKPGMSKNRRVYTRPMIAVAVARAQERVEAGNDPMVMLSHHAAGDDSTRIIGSVTGWSLDEQGNARYRGTIADTPAGRTIAALADTTDGKPPHLSGGSIRGYWLGEVRNIRGPDGEPATTADGLELDGIDPTRSPGVPGAGVDSFEWTGKPAHAGETTGRVPITESAPEALVTITEETPEAAETAPVLAEGMAAVAETTLGGVREALHGSILPDRPHAFRNGICVACPVAEADSGDDAKKPYGDVVYADPGYQKDGKKRYPLDSSSHIRSAWGYINQKANAALYTAQQLKRVRGRIMKAMKSIGAKIAAEGWSIEPALQVTEAVAEFYGDPSCAGSWSINASNGPVSICLSSYSMDPADLDVILRAAADAACHALADLDPDMDGDVDVAGVGTHSDPNGDAPKETAAPPPAAIETAPGNPATPAPGDALLSPPVAETDAGDPEETITDPAPDPAADAPSGEEPAVSEPTEAAGQAPAATTETVPSAATPATESAAPGSVTLSGDQFAQLLAAVRPAAPVAPAQESAPAQAAPDATETAPAAPAAPAVTETEDQRIERLVSARLDSAVTEAVQRLTQEPGGTPSRKGLAAGGAVNEHTAKTTPGTPGLNEWGLPDTFPAKAPHKMSKGEWSHHAGTEMLGYVFGPKGERQQPAA